MAVQILLQRIVSGIAILQWRIRCSVIGSIRKQMSRRAMLPIDVRSIEQIEGESGSSSDGEKNLTCDRAFRARTQLRFRVDRVAQVVLHLQFTVVDRIDLSRHPLHQTLMLPTQHLPTANRSHRFHNVVLQSPFMGEDANESRQR